MMKVIRLILYEGHSQGYDCAHSCQVFMFGLDRTDTAFVSLPLICGVSVCSHIDIQSASINLMFDIHGACHIAYHWTLISDVFSRWSAPQIICVQSSLQIFHMDSSLTFGPLVWWQFLDLQHLLCETQSRCCGIHPFLYAQNRWAWQLIL
jgi:hypothetical protein